MSSNGQVPSRRERKLPKQQLAILAICRFAEPLASTSLNPYLPEMIRSFNIPNESVGAWVGICSASFSICQALTGIPWGRASDRYGRKPAILLGLASTLITSLILGFSVSLPMAIAARAIAGAGNGNVGIIRTTVAEMVPFKELQPRAFSIMPLVWNVGSIFGPSIGGTLANPLGIAPGERTNTGSLFERFPYALPNLVSAVFFLISITIGTFFIKETLETKRGQRDYGLLLGQRLVALVKDGYTRVLRKQGDNTHGETEPLIKPVDEETDPTSTNKPTKLEPPPWRDVLTKQAMLNLVVYFFIAIHTITYDGLLPVMMSDHSKPHADLAQNPLKFFGGFGLTSTQIGLINTGYAIFGMFMQFFVYPPMINRLGLLYCLKWCVVVFPTVYLLTPFTVLMPSQAGQVGVCFIIQLVKELCSIFAFPSCTILLTNSASSLRVLGTLNGIGTSVAAIGRAFGPAVVGAIYAEGARKGYLIAPWWVLALIAALGAIPVFTLVEGKGFASEDNIEATQEHVVGEEDDDVSPLGLDGNAEANGETGSVIVPEAVQHDDEESSHRGRK